MLTTTVDRQVTLLCNLINSTLGYENEVNAHLKYSRIFGIFKAFKL